MQSWLLIKIHTAPQRALDYRPGLGSKQNSKYFGKYFMGWFLTFERCSIISYFQCSNSMIVWKHSEFLPSCFFCIKCLELRIVICLFFHLILIVMSRACYNLAKLFVYLAIAASDISTLNCFSHMFVVFN